MKIEINKQITITEIIDIELPYFYKQDLMSDYGDAVIYGKIEEKNATAIHETKNYDGEEKYEVEKCPFTSIGNSGFSCYFREEYKSTKEEFEAAKKRCIAFINQSTL